MPLKPKPFKSIIQRGAFVGEPSNIRGAHSHPPYTWGPGARYSHILAHLGVSDGRGKILKSDLLWRLGAGERSVAERWFNTDDPQFPSQMRLDDSGGAGANNAGGALISLNDLIAAYPEEVLGAAHLAAFGPAMAMVTKDLDAAEPLSWQIHIGVGEGSEVREMPEGTGLLLGPAEPASDAERRRLLIRAKKMLEELDPRVIRLTGPVEGVETPALFNGRGLEALVKNLSGRIREDSSISSAVKLLMLEGYNVIDVMGFARGEDGKLSPRNSLIQIHFPKPGDRIVTRDRMPHALFGAASSFGPQAVAWITEFKQTSLGRRRAAAAAAAAVATATSGQTWSLSDNLMGKQPRPGKVTRARLEEAFAAMERAGVRGAKSTWRALQPRDYHASPRTDASPVKVAPGIRKQRVHNEPEYGALKIFLGSGKKALLGRNGRHSALKVNYGAVRISDSKGKVILDRLGFDGKGWDGSHSDEAVIFAAKGNLLLESVGHQEAILYDAIRPLPGNPALSDLSRF